MLATRQHSSIEWPLDTVDGVGGAWRRRSRAAWPFEDRRGGASFEASSARNAASLMRRQVHGQVSRARRARTVDARLWVRTVVRKG